MACGCGGMRKKKQQVADARVAAVDAPVRPGARRRGEIIPGSTWNGRANVKPA